MPSLPFSLWTLPGLAALEAWPPRAGHGPCCHAFQAGPVGVQVLALPEDPSRWLAILEPLASPDRRRRAGAYRFPADALRCLGAEALLRHALRERHGLDPAELRFETTPLGKPALASHPAIHFNLTHSGPWILCALHGAPVGIDVEVCLPRTDLPFEGLLAPDERQAFLQLPPGAAQTAFYRLWTLKESLLKAMGTGLNVAPSSLTLRGPGLAASHPTLDLAGWTLREVPMPEGVQAALCHA